MKRVRGIWIPDAEEHLAQAINHPANPLVNGKGTYQFNKYSEALKHVRGRRHAVDVGANVGLWSRVMELDFDVVTAIEPVLEHRLCFALNVEKARLLPVALGAGLASVSMTVPPANSATAYVSDEGEPVEMVSLDSLRLGPVDFMKIDVEGYELDVVFGGEETIRGSMPTIIIEQKPGNAERYGDGQRDAVELLQSWGMVEAAEIGGDHIMVWPCLQS